MKIRHCREKVVVFMFSIILVMGMAACSFDTSDGVDQGSETPQSEAGKMETPKTQETTAPEDNGNEYPDAEEISVGDPIVGIVDQFADNIIAIKDAGDPDLVYYFSTQNAQVVEGDSPIAVGDMVAITYRGVMGDEEHPGEAVKVVAESMMYQ